MKSDAARILELVAAARRIPYCPQVPEPKQRAFLASNARELLYGGSVGGMKSSALLMGALQHVDVPRYAAILFRKTYADLSKPGALMDRAAEWLRPTSARWNDTKKQWRFPTITSEPGAVLSFGYLDAPLDRYNHQGAEYQYAGFDELTQFREADYLYIHGSRMRKLAVGTVPLRTRGATNPGGAGHKWVQRRFGISAVGKQLPTWRDGARTIVASQRPFIPSKLGDNPHLDATSYLESLADLDAVTQAQLRDGMWIEDESGRVYQYAAERNNCTALPTTVETPSGLTVPLDASQWRWIFVVDLGSSVATPTTGLVLLAWHPHLATTFAVRAWRAAGLIPSTVAKLCREVLDEHEGCELVMDEGALGHGYGNEMRDVHSLPVIAAEKRDKAANRKLLNGAFEQGRVMLLEDSCAELQEELETLVWNKAGNDVAPGVADHCSDGLLYGWRRSQAHRSEAPSAAPLYGSEEFFAAQERRLLDLEYERHERSGDETPWTTWRG